MKVPKNLFYTKDHEWVIIDGNLATMGITDHAQSQLGDIVFVEFPEEGTEVGVGDSIGVVESTKAVSDYYSPVVGTVKEVNNDITDEPDKINSDPYGAAWLVKFKFTEKSDELMSPEEYENYLKEEN